MNGIVAKINPRRGMVGVKTENGDFSVFELLSSEELGIGDRVAWKEETVLGSAMLRNITRNSKFEVYFQNHHVHQSLLDRQLLF